MSKIVIFRRLTTRLTVVANHCARCGSMGGIISVLSAELCLEISLYDPSRNAMNALLGKAEPIELHENLNLQKI